MIRNQIILLARHPLYREALEINPDYTKAKEMLEKTLQEQNALH